MLFEYSAKTLQGAVSVGTVDASGLAAARQLLKSQGLFVLELKERLSKATGGRGFATGGRRGVSKRDLLLFTTQLSIMCRSGVNLAEAISNVAQPWPAGPFRDVLQRLYKEVSEGQSVSIAMRNQIEVFGDAYVAGVASGEASGNVPEVLTKLAELLRNEVRLMRSIRAAMAYPIVLMFIATIVTSALIFFVLPQFAGVFHDMEIPVPTSTQLLLSLSGELRSRFWLWGGLCVVAFAAARRYLRSAQGKRNQDLLLLSTPLLRDVAGLLFVGRSFRMLGTMLQSGVPLLESIQLVRKSVTNTLHRELFNQMHDDVVGGRGIGLALSQSPYVPRSAMQMVATAERTGKLGTVMQIVGEYFEEEGEERLRGLTKLLEPLVIVVMGLIVAFIVASTMLPLFDFSQASR